MEKFVLRSNKDPWYLTDRLWHQQRYGICVDLAITFKCGNLCRVHKCVMFASSSYLKARIIQLENECRDDMVLQLHEVEYAGFEPLIRYMYTGELHMSESTFSEVQVVAEYLELEEVVRLCKGNIQSFARNENADAETDEPPHQSTDYSAMKTEASELIPVQPKRGRRRRKRAPPSPVEDYNIQYEDESDNEDESAPHAQSDSNVDASQGKEKSRAKRRKAGVTRRHKHYKLELAEFSSETHGLYHMVPMESENNLPDSESESNLYLRDETNTIKRKRTARLKNKRTGVVAKKTVRKNKTGEKYLRAKLSKVYTYTSPCKCKAQCFSQVDEQSREQLHNDFWNLHSYEKKNEYILSCMKLAPVKRRRLSLNGQLNSRTIHVVFNVKKSDGTEQKVCKYAFLVFHRVSRGKVDFLIRKHRDSLVDGNSSLVTGASGPGDNTLSASAPNEVQAGHVSNEAKARQGSSDALNPTTANEPTQHSNEGVKTSTVIQSGASSGTYCSNLPVFPSFTPPESATFSAEIDSLIHNMSTVHAMQPMPQNASTSEMKQEKPRLEKVQVFSSSQGVENPVVLNEETGLLTCAEPVPLAGEGCSTSNVELHLVEGVPACEQYNSFLPEQESCSTVVMPPPKPKKRKRGVGDMYKRPKENPFASVTPCKCSYKCFTNVDAYNRERIFQNFWSYEGYDKQNDYLYPCVEIAPVQSRAVDPKRKDHLRKVVVKFFVPKIDGTQQRVCKYAFMAFHGLKRGRVNYVIAKRKAGYITPYKDKRGKFPRKPDPRLEVRDSLVKEHINLIFRIMCAKAIEINQHGKTKPQEYTRKSMYENYRTVFCVERNLTPVSLDKYNRLFAESQKEFHQPQNFTHAQ